MTGGRETLAAAELLLGHREHDGRGHSAGVRKAAGTKNHLHPVQQRVVATLPRRAVVLDPVRGGLGRG